jgi:hypothetical protein
MGAILLLLTGQGVVVVDGRLVEALHVDEAKRVLELHNVISELAQKHKTTEAAAGAQKS